MKAVNSSSSLLNVMIPQFQQLLPLETTLSGSWLNNNCSGESVSITNKQLSSSISMTPSSICTDLSECEYQPMDLSSSNKYSLSSPPLSNVKSESIDLIDCPSLYSKQDSSNHSKSSYKTVIKQPNSNFSIDHLLSSSFRSPTYQYLSFPYKQIHSIFTKKQSQHFSDYYLHRIIQRRKQFKQTRNSYSSNQPRGIFLRYIFDLHNDLIHQQNQIKSTEKSFPIDALEQLAEIACKLDTRQKKSILLNENILTIKNYDSLIDQCYFLVKEIHRKYQQKKLSKRLNFNSKFNRKKTTRFLQFSLAILNLLQMKKNILLYGANHFDCHILMSDIRKNPLKKKKIIEKSICCHLKSDQIMSNLEILLPNNGLLYEASIQPIEHYDDLLLVRLNYERQTYLIPIHDLCRLACQKMIPKDFDSLSKGSRVCAFWSTSLRGLHPAIVNKIPSEENQSSMVGLIFDDGDTGLIKLDEIRLLPDDYVVKGINLEEWRVSSFQIPASSPTTRRVSRRASSNASVSTSSSVKKVKKGKTSSSSPPIVPQWTLNPRNSTICRHDNKEILRAGDCIILHGIDQSLSYIGKVLKFYRNKSNQQDFVRLKWYYSPQETSIGLHENDLPGALYESTHVDENPIATIRYKGTIYRSYDDYIKTTDDGKKRKKTDFYLVGHYNPTTGELQRYDDK